MNKKIYLLLIMLLSVFFSTSANADSFLTVPENDWLVNNIMTPLFSASSSPFSAVSKVFLGGVLAFGGILATYTMLVGTMSTAHDGQALGKKWSSVWVPVRTSLGVALIVPIKNGFCGIQLIIVWLALQGVALADSAWDEFAKNPLQGAEYSAPAIVPGLKPIFIKAMQSGACEYALNSYAQKTATQGATTAASAALTNSGDISNFSDTALTATGGTFNEGAVFKVGLPSNSKLQMVDPSAICGSYSLPGATSLTTFKIHPDEPTVVANLLNLDSLKGTIFTAQVAATKKMLMTGINLGYKLAGSNSIDINDVSTQMMAALNTYANSVSTAASSSFSKVMSSDGVADMQKDGFISAGSWFYRIVRVQQAVTDQVSAIPIESSNIQAVSLSGLANNILPLINKLNEIGNQAQAKSENLSEKGKDVDSMLNTFINSSLTGTSFQNMTENPLYAATNMGLRMVAGVGLAMTAILTTAVAGGFATGNAVSSLFGLDDAAKFLATFLAPLLLAASMSILLPGVYLAVYLPMIPFIIWTGTVIGWLVLVVEALFAGPLWAMAHMSPDSDGLVGRQGQGYMLIMSLILRPVLMVIGFVAALSMLKPAALFVNYFYSYTASGSESGMSGFVQIIGSMIVYCIILNNLVKKILSMIHSLPDAILQWIGGGGSNVLGTYAQGVEGGTNSGFAGGVLGGAAGSALSKGIGSMGGKTEERLRKMKASKNFAHSWVNQPNFEGLDINAKKAEMKKAYNDMYKRPDLYEAYVKSGSSKENIDFQNNETFSKYFNSKKNRPDNENL